MKNESQKYKTARYIQSAIADIFTAQRRLEAAAIKLQSASRLVERTIEKYKDLIILEETIGVIHSDELAKKIKV